MQKCTQNTEQARERDHNMHEHISKIIHTNRVKEGKICQQTSHFSRRHRADNLLNGKAQPIHVVLNILLLPQGQGHPP